MMKSMCLSARRELLISVRQKYRKAGWKDKGRILDGFVAARTVFLYVFILRQIAAGLRRR